MLVEEPSHAANETLGETLRQRIQERTGGRLWWVMVEPCADKVVLHGASPSYYVIQLALVAVREVLPTWPVELDMHVGFHRPKAAEDRAARTETFGWRHDQGESRHVPDPKDPPNRPVRISGLADGNGFRVQCC